AVAGADVAPSNDEPSVRIGEAAAAAGVSPSAIRLWERQGLISPRRSSGRYRLYSRGDVETLRTISRMRRVDKLNAAGIGRILSESPGTPGLRERNQGEQLRALRAARGLTLQQAAERAGLSVSFVSSVERGTAGASVSALQRLTSSYGATLLDLFARTATPTRLVRPGERPVLELAGPGVRIEQLSTGRTEMEPQLFVLAPGASSRGVYAHAGEEFMFLLAGSLRVSLGDDEEYTLLPEDSLYFSSSLPHRWSNAAATETRLLWINTPPTF
ncbi:MAG: MerR family transcriptional regulator, partial [Chloroflexota bacterium]|nr:MerR family transcriptional regulator [Chloroflexota bacterium]